MPSIPYKSFCWCLGTTSFRTKNFNKTIELQLALLDEFWSYPENSGREWNGNNALQTDYYDFMRNKGFVSGSANNKPKDAREKTSGLVDIGLLYGNRHLTPAGRSLLNLSKNNDFASDNFFQVAKDSYIYLKQLLKCSADINGDIVRPFIILIFLLAKFQYLSLDEFTYLLPLCTNKENTEQVIAGIEEIREGSSDIDKIIVNRLMNMDNYRQAERLLIESTVNKELICEIGLNRKSRSNDAVYFPLFTKLQKLYIEKNIGEAVAVFNATREITIGKLWREYLFGTRNQRTIEINPRGCLNATVFDNVGSIEEFKSAFFRTMHLLKAKATLSDYMDLNRRYVKTTDLVLFEENNVKLDLIPKYFFQNIANDLYENAFEISDSLYTDCGISVISQCLTPDYDVVIKGIRDEFGEDFTNIELAKNFLESRRYNRLKQLIDTKFTDEKLRLLLDCFERRDDNKIRNMVTDNADIPTIFEYILGIAWYKISERKGKLLDYLKLSLDADLLPKTHAKGGEADIVYEYEQTEFYPEHTLLLEATLADSTNQRRMEMEPVSRHLGTHLIRTGNKYSYCVFVTNDLHINVIADFRSRRCTPYYDTQDFERYVDGMKIIPIQTAELKNILLNSVTYKVLYGLFERAYKSNLPPHTWYSEEIAHKILESHAHCV